MHVLVLDQLRTVDRERLVKRLGALTAPTLAKALGILQEMFAARRRTQDQSWDIFSRTKWEVFSR